MFSIVVPLYNKELSIKNTINSVLNQQFQEFEIVVVNDGSTDKSFDALSELKNDRIRVITQENQGVSAARNRGIKEAKYPWIAFLDADDIWQENHLEEMKRLIEKYPTNQFFATSYERSDGKKIKLWKPEEDYIVEDYFSGMLQQHLVWTSVTVIHRSIFDMIDGFNHNLTVGEDLELWGRIGMLFHLVKSNKVTAIYKMDAENRSTSGKYNMETSFLSKLDFNSMKSIEELKFYRKLVKQKVKDFIVKGEIKNLSFLLKKYWKELLFY